MGSQATMDRETGIRQFDGTDFGDWKYRVEKCLQKLKLKYLIDSAPSTATRESANYQDNEIDCQLFLIKHISPCCLDAVKDKETAYEMMAAMKKAHEFTGLSTRSLIRDKINSLKYSGNEPLLKFFNQFDQLIREYKTAGGSMPSDEILLCLLETMPEEYDSIVTVLQVQAKNITISLESAKNSLIEYEAKKRKNMNCSNASNDSVAFSARKGTYQKNKNQPQNRGNGSVRCYNCNKQGHKADKCTEPKKKKSPNQGYDRSWAVLGSTLLSSAGDGDEIVFIIDSGATEHLVSDLSLLTDIKTLKKPFNLSVAKENQHLKVEQCGNIPVTTIVNGGEMSLTITDACFAPGLTRNLFSVRKIEMRGGEVTFKNGKAFVKLEGTVIAVGHRFGHLYLLKFRRQAPTADVAIVKPTEQLWHRRLGHLNMASVKQLVEGGMATCNDEPKLCEPCVFSKSTRLPFNGCRPPTKRPLERVHSDVGGPMPVSIFGDRFYVTFIDDFTHFTVTYPMKQKSDVFQCFKKYHKMATAHFNLKMESIRSDNGGEYISNQFKKYLSEHGIRGEYTVPYNPELNGVAERMNRTIVEKARCMLRESGLTQELWSEALMAATYLVNRSPTKALKDMTPFEMWNNRKPDISHLRVFGSVAYAQIPKQLRKKLDDTSRKMRMVGYDLNGYRLYDEEKKIVKVARNIVFDENVGSMQDTVSVLSDELSRVNVNETAPSLPQRSTASINPANVTPPQATSTPIQNSVHVYPTRERRPPERYGNPVNWSQVDLMTDDETVEYDESLYAAALNAAESIDDVPKTFGDVENFTDKAEWRKAIQEEVDALIENETWSVVDMPKGARLIDTKWVFKIKNEPTGIRYKARLVVRGYRQREGFDYHETYSPVARLPTIRTLLAVGVQHSYYFQHLDVKTAFLNGILNETIYLKVPEGIDAPAGKVFLLRKSLYGLKQAPKQWNVRFNQFVKSLGFKQSLSDPCLYTREDPNGTTYIVMYVDDIIAASYNQTILDQLVAQFSAEFKMSNLGQLSKFMGIDIVYNREQGWLTLSQEKYAEQILAKCGMKDCKPIKTPMDGLNLPDCDPENKTAEPYREMIGSLMYLVMGTRPDLTFTVTYLSRFQEAPTDEHWSALKRVLRYLQGSKDLNLVYQRNPKASILDGYADSDYASDPDPKIQRKSTSGFITRVYSNTVQWCSRKQPVTALSTCEAEYMAACIATQELNWMIKILTDMNLTVQLPVVLYEDNQGCKAMSEKDEPRRTKHMEIKWYYLRQNVAAGRIVMKYISTNNQQADILTKPLNKDQHERNTQLIGLKRGGVLESK